MRSTLRVVLVGVLCLAAGILVVTYRLGHGGSLDRIAAGEPGRESRQSGQPSSADRGQPITENLSDSPRGADHRNRQGVLVADWGSGGGVGFLAFLGGAFPGTHALEVSDQPANDHTHWLKIKLVGTKANRLARGAQIQVDLKAPDSESRAIHRTVGNNGSFGGNSSVVMLGLGDATYADQVTVRWPITRKTEVFHKVPADQFIEITEAAGTYRVIRQKVLQLRVPAS